MFLICPDHPWTRTWNTQYHLETGGGGRRKPNDTAGVLNSLSMDYVLHGFESMSSSGEYLLLKVKWITEEFSSDLCVELIQHVPAQKNSYLWITSCQVNVCIAQSWEERNIFFQAISLGDGAKVQQCSSNSPSILQKGGNSTMTAFACLCSCVCVCVCVYVCVMAQHMHTLYYYRCTWVVSMLLGLCFHASVALIESNHGGRAPLWHEAVHDIVESVLVGSIDACFQGHRGVVTGLRALSVCLDSWLGNTWPSQCRSLPGLP